MLARAPMHCQCTRGHLQRCFSSTGLECLQDMSLTGQASGFYNNQGGYGGAVYAITTTVADETIMFDQGCAFKHCSAVTGGGGAVAARGGPGLLLAINCTDLSDNTGLEGGAILAEPLSLGSRGPSVVLSHASVVDNRATEAAPYSGGGAVLVFDASLVVMHSEARLNTASLACGGGVSVVSRYVMAGHGAAEWGNDWSFNGAMAAARTAGAGLYAAWSLFSQNQGAGGGAMCVCQAQRRALREFRWSPKGGLSLKSDVLLPCGVR